MCGYRLSRVNAQQTSYHEGWYSQGCWQHYMKLTCTPQLLRYGALSITNNSSSIFWKDICRIFLVMGSQSYFMAYTAQFFKYCKTCFCVSSFSFVQIVEHISNFLQTTSPVRVLVQPWESCWVHIVFARVTYYFAYRLHILSPFSLSATISKSVRQLAYWPLQRRTLPTLWMNRYQRWRSA